MSLILFLKLTLAPCLVALASLAMRRWGLKIGGILGAFPVVIAPILFFFAVEHGSGFAGVAALKSLEGLTAFAAFCLTMSWASLRFSLPVSLVIGWSVFFTISLAGLNLRASVWEAACVSVGSVVLVRYLLPKPGPKLLAIKNPLWDLPARMATALVMVLGLTTASRSLGPLLSGALTPFPVAGSTLAIFAYISDGPRGPAGLFKGSLLGSLSIGAFCGALVLALPSLSMATAFSVAVVSALGVQMVALFFAFRKN